MYKNIILITIVMLLTVTSQTLLKKGVKIIGELKINSLHDLGVIILKLIQNEFIILGICIMAITAFLWLTVISKFELTTVFPISGGIFYILLFLFSWFFLGETMTLAKILGVAVIISGIYIISR